MGNADLRDLATIEEVPWGELDPGVVAVDAHNWLYRYLTTTVRFTNESVYTTAGGEEVANLVGIVQGLPKFFEHDLTPVMVFDGGPSELKADEIAERRERRESLEDDLADARAAGDALEVARLESATQQLTDVIQETSRELLERLDVPVVEAPAEGEAQAAHMAKRGDVDYVGTEDYDALLFGAPETLRQLTSSGDPEVMSLESTLADLDVTLEQLVDVAILCGTDFNDGVHGYGPKTALTAVREHGDLWGVVDAEDVTVDHGDLVRQLFADPNVTDDYAFDTAISPDVDAAIEYVTETWEIPLEEVERGFERIEAGRTQTGLDEWT